MALTREGILKVIERSWVQMNKYDSRFSQIKDCYHINLFTKEIKNIDTGTILSTSDNDLSVYPKPHCELVKTNGKTTSMAVEKIRKVLNSHPSRSYLMSAEVQEFTLGDKSIMQINDGLYYEDKAKKILTFFPLIKEGSTEYLLSPFTGYRINNKLRLPYKDLVIYHVNNLSKNHRRMRPLDNWSVFLEVKKYVPDLKYRQLTDKLVREYVNIGYSENLLKVQKLLK